MGSAGAAAHAAPDVARGRGDELSRTRPFPGEEEDHGGPADAEQQAIGAGHIGQRELILARDALAGLPGEQQIDRIFGQHGDEGNEGHCERCRDVVLRRLGAGRDQEGGGEDAEAEDGDLELGGDGDAAKPDDQRGQAERDGRKEQRPGRAEFHPSHPTQVSGKGRAPALSGGLAVADASVPLAAGSHT